MDLICTIYTLHTAYIYTYIYCLHAWLFSLSMVDNWSSIDNGCLLDLFAAIGWAIKLQEELNYEPLPLYLSLGL